MAEIHDTDHVPNAADLLTPESVGRFSPAWAAENVLKPAMNAGPLGVYNTAADLVHLPALRLEMGEAEPYTPEWFARAVSGGVGAAVPFALMGAASGRLMEAADRRLAGTALGARLSPYLTSERIATVAGASVYAALQRPDADHTRLGNALGTAAGMAVFIGGASLVKDRPMMQKALAYPLIGFVGGGTMVEASQLASNLKLARNEQALQGAVLGMTMNSVMGLGSEYLNQRLEKDQSTSTDKIVVPLDTDGCSTRLQMDHDHEHHQHDHKQHSSEEKSVIMPRESIRQALARTFNSEGAKAGQTAPESNSSLLVPAIDSVLSQKNSIRFRNPGTK